MLEWKVSTSWCRSGTVLWVNGVARAWIRLHGGYAFLLTVVQYDGRRIQQPVHSPEAAKAVALEQLTMSLDSLIDPLMTEKSWIRREAGRLSRLTREGQAPQQP
jgi:hypothetical protein